MAAVHQAVHLAEALLLVAAILVVVPATIFIFYLFSLNLIYGNFIAFIFGIKQNTIYP
jgi:hypothetical protein